MVNPDLPFPSNILSEVIANINTDLNININTQREYQFRNCIRPSSLKYATPKGQIYKLFNPDQLYAAGLIDFDESQTLKNSNFMDVSGHLNCTVGTIIHAIYLPAFEKALISLGVSAKQEHPLISKKYCIEGQADLVLFDHEEKTIQLVDLKTTGPAVVDRDAIISHDYMRQLLAYALCLEELYPDYKIESCCILSLCKTPNSTVIVPIEPQDKWKRGEVREIQVTKLGLPMLAQWELDFTELKNYRPNPKKTETFLNYFEELSKLVVSTNQTLKQKIKKYDHWVLNEALFDKKLVELEKEFNNE